MKKTAEQSARGKSRKIMFPPVIKVGDTIGLVAPAGPIINQDNFAAGIDFLEKYGFRVRYNRRLLHAKGYLAGSDRERADDFNRLWSDPEVKALVAARGGYGCLRLLDLLDMKQVRQHPKIFIGFSDLTVLLTAITLNTGLVTFHGPVVTTLAGIDKQSQKNFLHVLTENRRKDIRSQKLRILKHGQAQGFLFGGNLTTLAHTIGTPFEIPWDQAILFLEDTGEAPYRLDRLLTHLHRAGRLQRIRGLILGTFTSEDRKVNKAMTLAVHKRVIELLEGVEIPVWANFPVGHGRNNLTLPVGAEVEMDSEENTLWGL